MSRTASRASKWPKRWILALLLALVQNAIAAFAVYSSSQDVLSDGACLGGIFGTLANLAIIFVVVLWAIILAVKSRNEAQWHTGLKPLVAAALSSTTAVFIGLNAGLSCTV